jgi:hypothetical protein
MCLGYHMEGSRLQLNKSLTACYRGKTEGGGLPLMWGQRRAAGRPT